MLGVSLADWVRVIEVAAFIVLAMFLPAAIRVHSRPGRETDSWILAATVWAIFAAGITSIAHRWGTPLNADTTVLRFLAIGLGVVYVARNRRIKHPAGRYGEDWS